METIRQILTDELLSPLADSLKESLQSVVLYGNSVPFLEDPNPPLLGDVNILLILKEASLEALDVIRKILVTRNLEMVELVILDQKELEALPLVFPLEFQEVLSSRFVLMGVDPWAKRKPNPQNIEHQIQFELASKLHALRAVLARLGPTEPGVGVRLVAMARAFLPLARRLLESRGVFLKDPQLETVLAHLSTPMSTAEGSRPQVLCAEGAEAVRELRATFQDRRRPSDGEKRQILEAFLKAWKALQSFAETTKPTNRPDRLSSRRVLSSRDRRRLSPRTRRSRRRR